MNIEWSCPKAEHYFILSASFVLFDQMGIEVDTYITSKTKNTSHLLFLCLCQAVCFLIFQVKEKSLVVRNQNMIGFLF